MYCINPKATTNYRKSCIDMNKTDPMDVFLIADFARIDLTKNVSPSVADNILPWNAWPGTVFILRNSSSKIQWSPVFGRWETAIQQYIYRYNLGSTYGVYVSQEIIDSSEEELLDFLAEKSRNRIADISKPSELLKKAASDSYRLDECIYEPLNVSLSISFNCIQVYQCSSSPDT